jgi:hypothetical protein
MNEQFSISTQKRKWGLLLAPVGIFFFWSLFAGQGPINLSGQVAYLILGAFFTFYPLWSVIVNPSVTVYICQDDYLEVLVPQKDRLKIKWSEISGIADESGIYYDLSYGNADKLLRIPKKVEGGIRLLSIVQQKSTKNRLRGSN